jgi:hypothetical protein
VRDGRLRDVDLLDDLVDRQPGAAAQVHDLLAGGVCQGLGEKDGVGNVHIDNLLYVLY